MCVFVCEDGQYVTQENPHRKIQGLRRFFCGLRRCEVTDVEFTSFDQLSDEAINAEGLHAHLTSAEKRILLRRIMHSCHNGHKDFDDSSVVFLIRFQKVWKYQNVMLRSSDH
jgi:hypothetical protein